jgi:hypothetical protein
MAYRKKADVVLTVEPAIEQPTEQPVKANIATATPVQPFNVTPVRVERPAARQSSNVRPASKGNKSGAKSGGGKGSPGKAVRVGGGGYSQGIVGNKPKKKKAKKRLTFRGKSLGDLEYKPSKKTTKKGLAKRGPSKRH